jgi:hypothetical protein
MDWRAALNIIKRARAALDELGSLLASGVEECRKVSGDDDVEVEVGEIALDELYGVNATLETLEARISKHTRDEPPR